MRTKISLLLLCLLACFLNLSAQEERVIFSAPGGFYAESFPLALNCFYTNHHIRYTTNGNTPTATSPCYTTPLLLNEELYSTSDIYTIPTSPSYLFYEPDSVRHAIVIRAAVFDEEEQRLSDVATCTYFIHSLGCDTHGLPVISIAADSLDLFGYEQGILVPGVNYNPMDSVWSGNYYQSGEEWERLVHVEFYEADGTQGISQDAGLRTHGGTARRGPQKGLKLYAREEYGTKRFKYPFFQNLSISSFKHLVLKPFSCQWFGEGIQDDICNRMASEINVEALASRPAVMFLNGEYWGIYYIRERPDTHYLEDHFGHEDTDYNLIGNWYGGVEGGENTHFNEMMNWLLNSDLTQEADYEQICSLIDIDCFIDYYCLELFIANNDWPANNMRCYQLHQGKWRWIFFDGDDALLKMNFDVFGNATATNSQGWPTNFQSTLLFRKLLENNDFCNRFVTRLNDLMASDFNYSVTRNYYNDASALVREEIPWQAERFHSPVSLSYWEYGIANIDVFLQKRVENMHNRLDSFFMVSDENLNIVDFMLYPNPTAGDIHIKFSSDRFTISEIAIYNTLGMKIYSSKILLQPGENEFPLSCHFNSGLYILQLGTQRKKFIIQ